MAHIGNGKSAAGISHRLVSMLLGGCLAIAVCFFVVVFQFFSVRLHCIWHGSITYSLSHCMTAIGNLWFSSISLAFSRSLCMSARFAESKLIQSKKFHMVLPKGWGSYFSFPEWEEKQYIWEFLLVPNVDGETKTKLSSFSWCAVILQVFFFVCALC